MAHVRDQWFKADSHGRRVKTARHGTGRRWLASYQDSAGHRHAKSFDKKVDAERFLALAGADVARGPRPGPLVIELVERRLGDP